ncbi:MAG: c-type cytochrome [Planctomycetota bacterium]
MVRCLMIGLWLALPIGASLAAESDGLNSLVRLLSESDDAQLQQDILVGIAEGLEGRRRVEMPQAWPAASVKLHNSTSDEVRDRAIQLALVFDDPDAIRLLRERATSAEAAAADRIRAIELLVAKKDAGFDTSLIALLADPVTRQAALRGLAEYDHSDTVSAILDSYDSLDAASKQDALQTLASRHRWAVQLLDAIEDNEIASSDLNAYTVRQLMHSLGRDELISRVKSLWGEIRTTPADKAKLIANYKQQLTGDVLAGADLPAGRELFNRTCASCHQLFGEGKKIGPDITGSQRTNLDYILDNLIDPSGAVSKDFQMQIILTAGGRVITGLLVGENEQAITLQTVNERIVLPRDEIEERSLSPVSMMPDGQLLKLSSAEVRDLIAYLSSRVQVPLAGGQD